MLNILDLATTFNIGAIIKDKQPKTIREAFKTHWLNWASIPTKIVIDQGTEYYKHFEEMLNDLGIQSRLAPVEAPWQQGMVQRHEECAETSFT